jgi:hypothetical protein
MLNDLLPQWKGEKPISGKVTFEIPAGWEIATGETLSANNTFDVKNLEKAVFLVGKNWRRKTARVDKTNLSLVIRGDWGFPMMKPCSWRVRY